MPIEIITGLPGHGKTLLLLKRLNDAAEKGERPLFVAGVDGIRPGLATKLDDPTKWNDLDENGEHIVPDGSLIFVDECWKWYGHLHNARSQPNPAHVLSFAEHRHRGLDFVMTTQGPGQLYPFLRTLIEGHTHVVRAMGLQAANLFTWPELNDDVKSRTMRDLAVKKLWPYPTKHFDDYKSATQHTIKRKIPMRVFVFPLLLLAGLGLGYFGLQMLSPDAMADTISPKGEAPGLPGASLTDMAGQSSQQPTTALTKEAWLARFEPRFPQLPASAPAWDGRPVVSEPKIACMIGGKSGCACITEQGTKYELNQLLCVQRVMAGGVYDPFLEPERNDRRDDRQQNNPAGASFRIPGAEGSPGIGVGASASTSSTTQQARYGDFRP